MTLTDVSTSQVICVTSAGGTNTLVVDVVNEVVMLLVDCQ